MGEDRGKGTSNCGNQLQIHFQFFIIFWHIMSILVKGIRLASELEAGTHLRSVSTLQVRLFLVYSWGHKYSWGDFPTTTIKGIWIKVCLCILHHQRMPLLCCGAVGAALAHSFNFLMATLLHAHPRDKSRRQRWNTLQVLKKQQNNTSHLWKASTLCKSSPADFKRVSRGSTLDSWSSSLTVLPSHFTYVSGISGVLLY